MELIMYHPNQEHDVVLKCKCVTSPYGALKVLGENHEEQWCERHAQWSRIVRDATKAEQFGFYFYAIPVSRRNSSASLGDLLQMPFDNEAPGGIRSENLTLF
jgi:hypothetical protein